MLLSLFFFSCSTQQEIGFCSALCGEANEQVAVITSMDFARRRDDNGAALGFNLDNHETDFGDDEGCGLQDIQCTRWFNRDRQRILWTSPCFGIHTSGCHQWT